MKFKILFTLFFIFLINFTLADPSIGIEVTTLNPEYAVGDEITVTVSLNNKGTETMNSSFDVTFVSESVPGPSIWNRNASVSVSAGNVETRVFIVPSSDTVSLEPGVYSFNSVITIPDAGGKIDLIISDNIDSTSVVLVRGAPTAVPEIPVVFIVFIVLAVLFIANRS